MTYICERCHADGAAISVDSGMILCNACDKAAYEEYRATYNAVHGEPPTDTRKG